MKAIVGTAVVHDDAAELARGGAEQLAEVAREAVREHGRCTLSLTGGSSPAALYRLLAEAPFAEAIPWNDVHLFWGDDRVVPPDHPRSNFRLAHRLFIGHLGLPARNVHRVRGELGGVPLGRATHAELDEYFAGPPRFDLVHLGVGEDGHVASLFPFDRDTLMQRTRSVATSLFRGLGEWRVTLTIPALNLARRVEILLPSAAKARIARVAMCGPLDPIRVPAQAVRPADGTLLWRLTREVLEAGAPATTGR